MFGALTVGYLFLGGAGAGAIAVACVLDLLVVRAPFGVDARVSVDEAQPRERMVAFTLLTGLGALALGVLCLLFDLGRVDRVLSLFLRPSFTYLTVGAFTLVILMACGAFLVALRFTYVPSVTRAVVVVLEAIALVVGLVVMLYTGLLLQGMGAVALWKSPLVPILFLLSSLSCGGAVALIAAFFSEADDAGVIRLVRMLVRVDALIVILEALAAALLIGLSLSSDHPSAVASAIQLTCGDQALTWWGGFMLSGMAVPFVVELAWVISERGRIALQASMRVAVLAVAAVLVLVGGLSMRSSIVEAGSHRTLELEEVSALSGAMLEDPVGSFARADNDIKPSAQALRLE